ncbi:hypothetical protein AV530_019015 [Patagioenas fasciata monilis]|uniref:Uncharacterized protein n=1 Tax=Patagioenas fasciata monilis TaxID=372326 RepID=A0A1V4KX61_PATFA|nr:hypothetical protein AV530_019015 [Patagioenas fasciata monilis]
MEEVTRTDLPRAPRCCSRGWGAGAAPSARHRSEAVPADPPRMVQDAGAPRVLPGAGSACAALAGGGTRGTRGLEGTLSDRSRSPDLRTKTRGEQNVREFTKRRILKRDGPCEASKETSVPVPALETERPMSRLPGNYPLRFLLSPVGLIGCCARRARGCSWHPSRARRRVPAQPEEPAGVGPRLECKGSGVAPRPHRCPELLLLQKNQQDWKATRSGEAAPKQGPGQRAQGHPGSNTSGAVRGGAGQGALTARSPVWVQSYPPT